MSARPPPARRHISSLNPAHLSYSIAEWGDDDAWDSGSDDEDKQQTSWARTPVPNSASSARSTAPKPVPRPQSQSPPDQSTLAFSFTHVTAPSPGSYPPSTGVVSASTSAPSEAAHSVSSGSGVAATPPRDWTFVGKDEAKTGAGGREGDDEMVVGELEPDSSAVSLADSDADFVDMPIAPKSRPDLGVVKPDAEEIARGACFHASRLPQL